ncbi:hypothetical protein XU18_2154 [Perkinsela sp. CCAP 1560/4]|nr:hypothetical protein XU18_2154 [Perkinsela sp. CCAP 1560/4]|eukprot:KNH07109.1 hypothetical protein XU18_2154 [Perkinsela sp. CCAP 1560/4]
MAEIGKGDPRWIVNDREDGNNVNRWHWDQKDKTEATHESLKKLFLGRTLHVAPDFEISSIDLKSFTGDVTVANRKGRLLCFFDMTLCIRWKAMSKDEGKILAEGKFSIDDCDTQNYSEDFPISVTSEHKAGDLASEILLAAKKIATQEVRNVIRDFVDETLMKENGVPARSMTTTSSKISNAQSSIVNKSVTLPTASSIKFTRTWFAEKEDIYDCFTKQGKVSAVTRSACRMNAVVGGKFGLLNEFITGEFLDLKENSEIRMRWRLSNWDTTEGLDSIVSIKLEGEDGKVRLAFEHTGIPTEKLEQVEKGWEANFWGPMKSMLGYGWE